MFCPNCGREINNNAEICIYCGCPTRSSIRNNPTAKNKWVALLLCFFLGYLGVHKFYEGKVLLGFFYLLTFGFWGIGVFIDFIILLFKPNPYYP